MDSFDAQLKKIGMTAKAIEDINKKKKYAERIKVVLQEAKVDTCDKEVGQLLCSIAEKLNPAYNHRLPLLLKYVLSKEITSATQLDVAIDYFKTKGTEEIAEAEFKAKVGIDVNLKEEDIVREVKGLIDRCMDSIKMERYRYQRMTLLYDLKKKYPFVDGKLGKRIVDEEVEKVLGGKNKEELEEDELKKKAEELKKKKKESKADFSTADLEELTTIKEKLKKIEDDFMAKKKTEEDKPEKDKLSSLMARDMKSALNPPELLKKHLEVTQGKVFTRFPPEPNGYLHIGHAKAMRFSFTSASAVGGKTYLRLDDTNPEKETKEFIESIRENVKWLGYSPFKETYASDYFGDLYEIAVKLIKKGLAYVCHQSKKEMAEYRDQKKDSPYRNRTVEENLKLFEQMKQGRFEEKECCLRVKIDMKHSNPCMRDFVAYRIKYVPHPHAGDKWCIYPTYDFTHCLNDSLENITHSLCTLEFEIRRDSYYWLLEAAEMFRPFVWEYSRLNITNTVLSKRKLTQLVTSHLVKGWDDPRMPTINGLRRRGYTADAINNFVDKVGVTRRGNENMISVGLLENSIKADLDKKAMRSLAVIEPLKVKLINLAEDVVLDSFLFPKLKEEGGIRKLTLSNVIFIERTDFKETDKEDFFGLTPTQEVGLKYGGFIQVKEVKKDNDGKVTELLCVYSSESKKLKGRIHWISEKDEARAEVRLYDYLFKSAKPMDLPEPLEDLNPKSLVIKSDAKVNKQLVISMKPFDHVQFERLGYFILDPDTKPEMAYYVFNLTIDSGDEKIKEMRR